jgi:hypothetical protein
MEKSLILSPYPFRSSVLDRRRVDGGVLRNVT